MNRLLLATIGTVFLAHLAVCQAQPRFEWAMGTFAGQQNLRVAMLVPVLIGKQQCHMQLDTGLPQAIAWHEYAGENDAKQIIKVHFADHHAMVDASSAVREMISRCQPGEPIGSLGNAFFEHGTLSIDFKNQRISHQAGSILQADLDADSFAYVKSEAGGAHVVIEVGLGKEKGQALLDTGSTALDVGAFGAANWQRLTNDAPLQASDQVEVFEVHAWGEQHRCFKAQSAKPLRMASKTIDQPAITYCPTIGMASKPGLMGVVGMRPFADDLLVIDYPALLWRTTKSTSQAD